MPHARPAGRNAATRIRADPQPPLFYAWHGTPYLGAAHGLMGILYALLHSPKLLQDPIAVTDLKAGVR